MKRLLVSFSFIISLHAFTQADFISIKKNGRSVKNFMAGSHIIMQTTDGAYWEGPIKAIQHDSLYLVIYDIRMLPTAWGTRIRDTISVFTNAFHYRHIQRIYLNQRKGFFKRASGPLLMLSGGGYLALNLANGAVFSLPVTDQKNLRSLSIAAGLLGTGFLLHKLFKSDGFTSRKHQIMYVNLSTPRRQL